MPYDPSAIEQAEAAVVLAKASLSTAARLVLAGDPGAAESADQALRELRQARFELARLRGATGNE